MSWQQVQLKDIVLQEKGSFVSGPFGSSISAKYFVDEGVPVIRGNNLTKGREKFIDDGFVFLTEAKAREFQRCNAVKDDIIFTAAGTIGQVGIIPNGSRFNEYVISNKQLRARIDKTAASPLFVFYWLSSKSMTKWLENMNNGGAVPLLNLGIVKRAPVPLPSLSVQEKIVEVISAYDDLIENNKRRIALLEESARQLYKEWFVRLRFPGYEHVKIVDGVPEGWEKVKVGDLLTLQRGFDLPLQSRHAGAIPIYASTGINGYHNEYKVKGPGIITGRSGSLGTVMFASSDFWPLNTALWVKEFKKVTPHYALFFLRELKLENYNGGAAVPTLNRNDIHRVEAFAPPAILLSSFSDYVIPVFKQIDKLVKHNEKLTIARDLLLPKLMTGELAV